MAEKENTDLDEYYKSDGLENLKLPSETDWGPKETLQLGLLLFAVVLWAVACWPDARSRSGRKVASAEQQVEIHTTAVWEVAKEFVKYHLILPSSARFANKRVTPLGNGRFVAEGWVDSQDKAGVLFRDQFFCVLQYDRREDEWELVSISISRR